MAAVYESDLEEVTLAWFAKLGYEILPADHLDPAGPYGERKSLEDTLLRGRLEEALRRLNPEVEEDAIQEAIRRIARREALPLDLENEAFHWMLTGGLTLEVPAKGGGIRGLLLQIIDFAHPEQNDWVVVNQVSLIDRATGTGQLRRPDLIVYVNGLPLAVIELKNPADPDASVGEAYRQLQTYKLDIPSLFVSNALLVISDDVHAHLGSLTADLSRFGLWRTVSGEGDEPKTAQPLDVLIRGVFDKARFLDLLHNFITFEHDRGKVKKKIAGYHQFHAVRRAVTETRRAAAMGGDQRIGVVWHTQGSGKSLTMVFYARKLILEPDMENPTLVVLTDRNDLDDQLFGTFSQAEKLLRQKPVQAGDRAHLRELLRTASGGVYFTTLQKFAPESGEKVEKLSDRRNIIVIADEAHRSQYGFGAKMDQKSGALKIGLAQQLRNALPNASFIGFTGTPVELKDKNTVQVFGDTFSVYDIQRSVEDKATVPIFYENRLAKLDLDESERPRIDPEFEELTEGEEVDRKEALKSEWSTVEALVGTEKRLSLVASDLVAHFEKRVEAMKGKALVVCMSRRICADLYAQIQKLRPHWHDDDDEAGAIKVVMTGTASDGPRLVPHVRSKGKRERLAERFKDPDDPLKLVIVRDMWLTGFDAPCMHTLYVDKPMRGHNLMQAIARVNRVFGDKPGGLVVDYIGIATFLRDAVSTYAGSGGQGTPADQQDKAAQAMLEKLEICRDVFHGFDYALFFAGTAHDRLALLPAAREHVLAQRKPKEEKGKEQTGKAQDGHGVFLDAVSGLTQAFALASPHEECEAVRDEVAFFQAVRAGLIKLSAGRRPSSEMLAHAVRQIVANAIVTDEVIDVFAAAGLPKPDISILSGEFLAEIQGMQHKSLAAALLRRLLEDEVRARLQRNVVQGKKFSELLEAALRRYQNRSIESVEVIEELLDIARGMRGADQRGEALKLSREEEAFFDALAENESAQQVLGDAGLSLIARELTQVVRANTSIDWNHKETVKARLRILLKKVLTKYGYPPDAQKSATDLVLVQAEKLGINVWEGGSDAAAGGAPDAGLPAVEARDLPYPIAVFDSLIAAQENVVLRVKTRRDAFEKALLFTAAVALGLVTEQAGGTMPEPALKVLKGFLGKPVSMGSWHEIACRLAALLPEGSSDPSVRAVRSLVTAEGKPSELAAAIKDQVIEDRNLFAHTVTLTAESVKQDEAELHALWLRFERALAGLREARLIARAQLVDTNLKAGTTRYQIRDLHGGSDHFPVREETVRGELGEGWCYLLRPDGRALSLSPMVSCVALTDGTGRDVFLCRKLELNPGKDVESLSVTKQAKSKLKVPAAA